MKHKNKSKLSVLKKIIGKRVAVITDYDKMEHYYGDASDVINESTVLVKNDQGEEFQVSIFDIRNPSQEL